MGEIVCSRASHRLAMFETMPVRDVSSRFVDTVDTSCSNANANVRSVALYFCFVSDFPFCRMSSKAR